MSKMRSTLTSGMLWLLLLLVPSLLSGPVDRAEQSVLGEQQAVFRDLAAEMRPFTNESSGALAAHVRAAMAVLKEGVPMNHRRSLQRNLLSALSKGAPLVCHSCQVVTKIMFQYIRKIPDTTFAANLIIAVCRLIVFRQRGVCEGIINGERPVLEYVIRNSRTSPVQLCKLIFSSKLANNYLDCGFQFRGDEWAVDIPPPLFGSGSKQLTTNEIPITSVAKSSLRGSHARRKRLDNQGGFNGGRPYLKMLHLTDLHYDPDYLEGSSAKCGAPLCCQKDSGPPSRPDQAAGKWGDYRSCDSPERLVINMLDHIRSTHPDIDYIIYTGDSVTHDLWKISREKSSFTINRVGELFSEYFPNTPIVGSLGNHEGAPRDSFPPPEDAAVAEKFSNAWLYNLAADHWQRHLFNANISKEARITGSYSVLVDPGLRVISLNTNFCYKLNMWVLYKNADPGKVLHWLAHELFEAEQRGEKVQIIGHIPPLLGDCYEQWGHQFSRIVTRFSNTIRGQFYGHSHYLEALINYDVDNPNVPVGVQYVTPSNTPFFRLNPSYTFFYIDGNHPDSTRAVLDARTFFMNLTAANSRDDVRWLPLYSAKEDLGLNSLEPVDWDLFVRRMNKDPELTRKFHTYQVTASDVLRGSCDRRCRKLIVCSMVDGNKLLPRKCKDD